MKHASIRAARGYRKLLMANLEIGLSPVFQSSLSSLAMATLKHTCQECIT